MRPPKGPLDFDGRVADKLTGKPLSGASVKIKVSRFLEQEGQFKTLQETTRTTNAEGKYAFTVGPELVANPAVYLVVETRHAGYMTQDDNNGLDVILRNQRRGEKPFFQEIQLRPARPIEGRLLTPAGKPAAGVVVMACSSPQNADDNSAHEADSARREATGKGDSSSMSCPQARPSSGCCLRTSPWRRTFWVKIRGAISGRSDWRRASVCVERSSTPRGNRSRGST